MADAARKFAEGNFDARVHDTGRDDEVGHKGAPHLGHGVGLRHGQDRAHRRAVPGAPGGHRHHEPGLSFFSLTYSYIMTEKRGDLKDKAEIIAQMRAHCSETSSTFSRRRLMWTSTVRLSPK